MENKFFKNSGKKQAIFVFPSEYLSDEIGFISQHN